MKPGASGAGAAGLPTFVADALCAVVLSGAVADARAVGAAIVVACALGAAGLLLRQGLLVFEPRSQQLGPSPAASAARAAAFVAAALAAHGRATVALALGVFALLSYGLGVRSWARRGGLYVSFLYDGVALLDAALMLAAHRPELAAWACACFIAARWLRRAEPEA